MHAIKADLGPLLGDTGLWCFKQYKATQLEKGNEEKNKKARVWQEIIEDYLAKGMDNLGNERKFNLKNRFCPKKLPARAVSRGSVSHIYSWAHYAP